MRKDREPQETKTVQQAIIKIDGFFDGKNDETDEEIVQVESWPSSYKLGHKIRNKRQELDWLNRLKEERERDRNYIKKVLEGLGEQQAKKFS